MSRTLNFAVIFKGDATSAKAAAREAANSVAQVEAAANASSRATHASAASLNDQAAATHKAAAASERLAKAEMARSHAPMALADHERRNLMFQVTDTFQSLAMGMPLHQVLLQQGPQITQVFGGVGNTLKAVASQATLARLAVGALAGVALIGADSWNRYLRSTKEVETAASGLGRAMAGTRQEMEASAIAGAEAAHVSVNTARSLQASFLRTGRIDSSNFEALLAISKDFAATVGADADTAGASLAQIFEDPAKGADTLFQKYGLINGATAQLAKELAAQNRHSEAQAVLLKALPASLADAEAATTALGRAWAYVKTSASNAGDAIGGAIDKALSPSTTLDQLKEAHTLLRSMEGSGWAGDIFGQRTGGVYGDSYAEAEIEFRRRLEDRKREGIADQSKREAALANRLTANAMPIAEASAANAAAQRQLELSNQIAALERARGQGGQSPEQQLAISRAIDAKAHALAGLASQQERQSQLDAIDVQLATERNPIRRAELVFMQQKLALADQEITASEAETKARQARDRIVAETLHSAQASNAQMTTELEVRRALNVQVANGKMTVEEANRSLQQEIELRPLLAAAAMAQGEEQKRLNEIIAERRRLTGELAEQERTAKADSGFQSYLKNQSASIDRLRMEIALVGRSSDERRQALALLEAEQAILAGGAQISADRANQMRREALAASELKAELERLREAWSAVDGATAAAIDGAIDSLIRGDLKGALRSIGQEVAGLLSELTLKNPLKNMILGTDLPTMSDVGGLGGIAGRLFGGTSPVAPKLAASAMNAASMAVTTPMVTLNAGNIAGLPAFSGGAGNASAVAMGASGPAGILPGAGGVQAQIWGFFQGKGLQPHQIAGIMGNVAGESGFNPLAEGDHRNGAPEAFGLFQWNDRRHKLFDFIGGKENLGNVQAQLEFAWHELMTTERPAFEKLMAATNTGEATDAFMRGFERPAEWAMTESWSTRMAGAEAALAKFEGTSVNAQTQLHTLGAGAQQLGTGMQQLGAGLAGTLQGIGASYGPGGALIGGLLGEGLQWIMGGGAAASAKPSGYISGGWTGPGATTDVAGVVHAEEYVFDAASTRKIGVSNLEAMRRGALRGYREGGYVTGGTPALPASMQGASRAAPVASGKLADMSHTFHINVSGTGNQEIQHGVSMAIQQAFETYDRNVFGERVRAVVNDRWGQ